MHYYNEIDKTAVSWLRNLIGAGLLPEGDVDDRSITEVQASDLTGYTQCHWFAGIGGWPLALQLAGWPTTRPVWTGSCPCQPFSTAGRHGGEADQRHLWPEFQRLIAECRPATVFGEQVASKAGRAWLAGVRIDLEALAFGVGAADLCAASVGTPHIRQRLYWVADSISEPVRAEPRGVGETTATEPSQGVQRQRAGSYAGHSGPGNSGVADSQRSGLMDATLRNGEHDAEGRPQWDAPLDQREPSQGCSDEGGVAHAHADGKGRQGGIPRGAYQEGQDLNRLAGRYGTASPWADSISIPCLDGKERRTQPGIRPLADGVPGRVGQLRAYGNAIVPQVAAEFITAYMEVMPID